jgi:hypothetical protein
MARSNELTTDPVRPKASVDNDTIGLLLSQINAQRRIYLGQVTLRLRHASDAMPEPGSTQAGRGLALTRPLSSPLAGIPGMVACVVPVIFTMA